MRKDSHCILYCFCLLYLKMYLGNNDEESSSKRKRLNPSEVLETFEEKYIDIVNEKEKILKVKNSFLYEKNSLLQDKRNLIAEKRGLIDKVSIANRQSEDIQNKYLKFTGKISYNLRKIFSIKYS